VTGWSWVFTDDPYTHLRPGDRGTITSVRDHPERMIEVDWDSGSALSILPDAGDRIRKLPPDGTDAATASRPTPSRPPGASLTHPTHPPAAPSGTSGPAPGTAAVTVRPISKPNPG
jgi:hypothetical protein